MASCSCRVRSVCASRGTWSSHGRVNGPAPAAAGAYGETLREQLSPWLVAELPRLYSHAQDVATIAAHAWSRDDSAAVSAAEALPLYLRDKVARKQ